jgi:hypothetical protein
MVKAVIYVVILVLVLSFFGVSLQHLVEGPTTQANFHYVWDLLLEGWDDIADFVTDLLNGAWNTVF